MPSVAQTPLSPPVAQSNCQSQILKKRKDQDASITLGLRYGFDNRYVQQSIRGDDFGVPRIAIPRQQHLKRARTLTRDPCIGSDTVNLSHEHVNVNTTGVRPGLCRSQSPDKVDLRPCHICYRKPSELRHLRDYADCEACEKRTCYVCIRQCDGVAFTLETSSAEIDSSHHLSGEGNGRDHCLKGNDHVERGSRADGDASWTEILQRRNGQGVDELAQLSASWEDQVRHRTCHVHKARVCSRCCVERGPEGEIWCFGCLRAEED